MFHKILIANRGEIACRIIKTARRLGIRTVAVYSSADADARHVRLADEALLIGPASARESYLVVEKIIAAARQSGAQAIHPGYGFLAESADFAAACAAAGICFIGPSAAAMRAMGDKAAAKQHMAQAGVPLLPGYHGAQQDADFLHAEADRIGYPLLIKACAGGGGKGMRQVRAASEFAAALVACQREAAASFGETRVLLERYLPRPRHIEVQVFADRHGNVVHLFERDCSVQRRYQKVVEEAPAPDMPADLRAALGAAAVAAARAVNYVGAGTVEFIVAAGPAGGLQNASFHFMEMNTRLQVEHPVTEMITGLDLVEWQLRVAAGEPLPLLQEQLTLRGHALEARIYAEDPARDFLPAPGRLLHLALPAETQHLRIDSGVEQGDRITPHYDPLIAKLVVWDETRAGACARLLQALTQCQIVGMTTNLEFLARLIACPAFAAADLDTTLIERERALLLPDVAEQNAPPRAAWLIAALAELLRETQAAAAAARQHVDPHSPWHRRDGWRINHVARRSLLLRWQQGAQECLKVVEVSYGPHLTLTLDDQTTLASGALGENGHLSADLDGLRLQATVIVAEEKRHVFLHGQASVFARVDPLAHAGVSSSAAGSLRAPMPGKLIALLVAPGSAVAAGAPLLILEAMKMEHTITAPVAGRLKRFCHALGAQVDDGAELVEFETLPATAGQ